MRILADLNWVEGLGGGNEGKNTLAIAVAVCNKHLTEDETYESSFQLKLVCYVRVGLIVITMTAMIERDTSYYSQGFYIHCFIS